MNAQVLVQSASNYLNPARDDLVGAYTSGRAYFGGGERGGPSANVDIYTISTGTWSTSLLSVPRDNLAAASMTDRVLFGGGSNGGANGDVVDIFFANGSQTTTLLSAPRKFLAGAGRGNWAAFGGGAVPFISAFTPSNVVDIYNSATNTWITGTLSVARAFLACAVTSRHIIFAGKFPLKLYPSFLSG